MMKKTLFKLSPLFALLILFTASALADTISLTLSNPTETATPGSTITFTATASAPLTNSATVFLNSDSFNLDSPLTLDDSGFFNNFPLSLDPGDSFTGELFAVDIPLNAAGVYNGSFEILGGADDNTFEVLASVPFQVNVAAQSAVPEPGSLMLFATGTLLLAFCAGRKRTAANASEPAAY